MENKNAQHNNQKFYLLIIFLVVLSMLIIAILISRSLTVILFVPALIIYTVIFLYIFNIYITFSMLGELLGAIFSGYTLLFLQILCYQFKRVDGVIKYSKVSFFANYIEFIPDNNNEKTLLFIRILFKYTFTIFPAIILFILSNNLILQIRFLVQFIAIFLIFIIILKNNTPIKNGDISTLITLSFNEKSSDNYKKQLGISRFLLEGGRYKDLPSNLLKEISKSQITQSQKLEPLSDYLAFAFAKKLLDEKNYIDSLEVLNYLLKKSNILKEQLINDKIFCLILLGEDKNTIKKLITNSYKGFIDRQNMHIDSAYMRTKCAIYIYFNNPVYLDFKDRLIFLSLYNSHLKNGACYGDIELLEALEKPYYQKKE